MMPRSPGLHFPAPPGRLATIHVPECRGRAPPLRLAPPLPLDLCARLGDLAIAGCRSSAAWQVE